MSLPYVFGALSGAGVGMASSYFLGTPSMPFKFGFDYDTSAHVGSELNFIEFSMATSMTAGGIVTGLLGVWLFYPGSIDNPWIAGAVLPAALAGVAYLSGMGQAKLTPDAPTPRMVKMSK